MGFIEKLTLILSHSPSVAVGMALVNCNVVNRTSNKTVLPWSILSAGITVQQFYDEEIVQRFPQPVDIEAAYLGRSKESLDKNYCHYPWTVLFNSLDLFCGTIPAIGYSSCVMLFQY